MTTLLVWKERLKQIYCKYGLYIMPVIKFLSVFISLLLINSHIGYMSRLTNTSVLFLIALICAILPEALITIIIMGVVIAQLYALSMELAIVTSIIILIMYLLYFRFMPRHAFVLILMPALFTLNVPYIVPLFIGLVGNPFSIISVIFGTVVYYIIAYTSKNAALITNMSADSGIQKISLLLDAILKNNKEMLLVIISFSIVTIAVYVIKRLSINHAWTIAIITGCILNIVILLIGELVADIDISVGLIISGNILAAFIVYVLHFFILTVDFSRTEYTQFEDDEYYYYVKAVPKMNVTAPEVKVKRINAQRVRRAKRH